MSITTLPAIDFWRTTQEAVRYPFLWRSRDLSVNAQSGQAGTNSRTAVTHSGVYDSFGAAIAANYTQPEWDAHELLGVDHEVNWFFDVASSLSWPVPVLPQAMCGMVTFRESYAGHPANWETFDAGVWDLSSGAATGARIFIAITSSGTKYYELVYTTDGVTFRRSTMAVATVENDEVRLRWQLTTAGVANLWQSKNGGAEAAGSTPAASTLPAAWSGTTMSLNVAEGSNYGRGRYYNCVVMMGNQTEAVLAAAIA